MTWPDDIRLYKEKASDAHAVQGRKPFYLMLTLPEETFS